MRWISVLSLILVLTLVGCKEEPIIFVGEVELAELVDSDIAITLNPSGIAPLSAEAVFTTKTPCTVELAVRGEAPVLHTFTEAAENFALPILGLYPGRTNEIVLTIIDEAGNFAIHTSEVTTDSIPAHFPDIAIDVAENARMEPGMHFSELALANFGAFNSTPIIFDNSGAIRWYLDLSDQPTHCIPIFRLKNGNVCFTTGRFIRELDMLGNELNSWDCGEGYDPHHEVIELPNGNFVVAVSKPAETVDNGVAILNTIEDHVLEIDRNTGAQLNEWDLREILDTDRYDIIDGQGDWFHMNAIWYNEDDNTLVCSGRNQGLVKINWDNELVWILSGHQGWGPAGRDGSGPATTPYLLTAVDASGTPYDQGIQDGSTPSSEFDWTWGQHAPMYLPNGNLFVFDNGLNRHYGASDQYSRGVEYEIDEANMTIRQVWDYGKDRGTDFYSAIISDVDLMPTTANRLIMPGAIRTNIDPQAKITEVTYPGKEVVFEARLMFKDVFSDGVPGFGQRDIVYRSERMNLYQ